MDVIKYVVVTDISRQRNHIKLVGKSNQMESRGGGRGCLVITSIINNNKNKIDMFYQHSRCYFSYRGVSSTYHPSNGTCTPTNLSIRSSQSKYPNNG